MRSAASGVLCLPTPTDGDRSVLRMTRLATLSDSRPLTHGGVASLAQDSEPGTSGQGLCTGDHAIGAMDYTSPTGKGNELWICGGVNGRTGGERFDLHDAEWLKYCWVLGWTMFKLQATSFSLTHP